MISCQDVRKKSEVVAKYQNKGPKVTHSHSPIKLCAKNDGIHFSSFVR